MVQVDHLLLSDLFIDSTFKVDVLRDYFDSDGWESVVALIGLKLKYSTCQICNLICIAICISCTAFRLERNGSAVNVLTFSLIIFKRFIELYF